MKQQKPRSVGTLHWPKATMERFDGRAGSVLLSLTNISKTVKVEANAYCAVRQMMRLAHEIVAAQRAYAMDEWNTYEQLKTMTGYKPPDGQE